MVYVYTMNEQTNSKNMAVIEGNTIELQPEDIETLANQLFKIVKDEKQTTLLEDIELTFDGYFMQMKVEVVISDYDLCEDTHDTQGHEEYNTSVFFEDVSIWDIDGNEYQVTDDQLEPVKKYI